MSNIQELNYKIIDNNEEIDSRSIKLKVNHQRAQQMYIIHRVLKQQLNNNRIRTANTKTKSEVRGGGRKPWKQKGTGRARAGSNRSPLWRGGGIIFGPRNQKYRLKINKKEKRLATNTIIANKFSNTIVTSNILDGIKKPSTKQAISAINKLGIDISSGIRLLIIVNNKTDTLHMSFKNIKQTEVIEVNNINILSLLKADTIIMTYKALEEIGNLN